MIIFSQQLLCLLNNNRISAVTCTLVSEMLLSLWPLIERNFKHETEKRPQTEQLQRSLAASFPDIVDVNYLRGRITYSKTCGGINRNVRVLTYYYTVG